MTLPLPHYCHCGREIPKDQTVCAYAATDTDLHDIEARLFEAEYIGQLGEDITDLVAEVRALRQAAGDARD